MTFTAECEMCIEKHVFNKKPYKWTKHGTVYEVDTH